jgi:aminopeptidase-like protein
MRETIRILERSRIYKTTAPCEPFLSKHGLEKGIPTVSGQLTFRDFLNVHMYCDGKNTTGDLVKLCKLNLQEIEMICEILVEQGIIN